MVKALEKQVEEAINAGLESRKRYSAQLRDARQLHKAEQQVQMP